MRITALLIAGVLSATNTLAQTAPARVDGPTVKVGDTWMFNKLNRNGELDYVSVTSVTRIDAEGIMLTSSDLAKTYSATVKRTRGFNLLRIDAPDFAQTFSPDYPNFDFPLQVGKTWKRTAEFTHSKRPGKIVRAELEGRVVGWESVTVPAGTFLALKIQLGGWYRVKASEISGRMDDTLWYAPEVRNAVRYEYKDTVGYGQAGGGSPNQHEIHELVRYWLAP